MRQLTVTQEAFTNMLSGLIQSGVTFEAEESKDGSIVIKFTGGY
jgi:hypothetical protein